jgi:hypothetical protein
MGHIFRFTAITTLALICSSNVVNMPVASAWDSNISTAIHSYLANWGIDLKDSTFAEPWKYYAIGRWEND